MRVQRRKHALHCRVDEIVIARLVVIHVILPNQLESLCENGNLRVAVILFAPCRRRFLRKYACERGEYETNHQRDDHQAPHISTVNPKFDKAPTIAQGRFLATANPKCCLSAVLIETRKNE